MTPWELEQAETLAFDAMVDVQALFEFMEELCEGTPYLASMPGGGQPCSRAAYDQLGLYQIARGPRAGQEGRQAVVTSSGHRLYTRAQLRYLHPDRSGVVTYCDGLVRLSNHQAPDPELARQSPELRGEGRALDWGLRRRSDRRFLWHNKAPAQAQELFLRGIAWLEARGWVWPEATRAVKAEVHDLKCRMGIGDDCGPKCPSVWVANPFMLAWFYPGRAAVFTILVAAILIQESRAWLLSLLPPLRWGVSL